MDRWVRYMEASKDCPEDSSQAGAHSHEDEDRFPIVYLRVKNYSVFEGMASPLRVPYWLLSVLLQLNSVHAEIVPLVPNKKPLVEIQYLFSPQVQHNPERLQLMAPSARAKSWTKSQMSTLLVKHYHLWYQSR